jgi:hypothetical protein
MSEPPTTGIETLNTDCTCITLDIVALCKAAEAIVGDPAFCRDLTETHPHLLSAQPMFLSVGHARQMRETINAIETVARLPAYREVVLSYAPQIARIDTGPIGVFMGYDFHIGETGPRLIEINTNAGGALINAYLLMAQRACCSEMEIAGSLPERVSGIEQHFVESFRKEWQLLGRAEPLRSVAIVDENPATQYLYPEFVLFQRLFQKHGLTAVIAAPDEFTLQDGKLWHDGQTIDLIYNRLTDFTLATPASTTLREAYLSHAAAITPNPRAHAIFADKRNLVLLSDPDRLRDLGAPPAVVDALSNGIPRTGLVSRAAADDLWSRRNKLFFKPCAGYGGKAAYRGDKITRKVWEDILSGSYVAQEIVPPSARAISVDGEVHNMKVDLRNYAYAGEVQLVAARIYEGQTTNFRTRGGGFAPVVVGDDAECSSCG